MCLQSSLNLHAGLIGWVPNCDTLHALIREFRDVRKIPLNVEHRLMLGMAPNYDNLTIIQKVEVFEHAMESTPGMILLAGMQEQLTMVVACLQVNKQPKHALYRPWRPKRTGITHCRLFWPATTKFIH